MEIHFERRRLQRRLDDLIRFAGIGGGVSSGFNRRIGSKAGETENASKQQGLHSSHMGCIRNEKLEKRKEAGGGWTGRARLWPMGATA
jgi:hypothetical protein